MKRSLLAFAFLSLSANAFFPQLQEQLSDVFTGRKLSDAVELDFRHQVPIREGEVVDVIERFIGTRFNGLIRWQIPGQPEVTCEWTGKEYLFRGAKPIPSRTGVFIDYFLAPTGGEFLDRLLRERFVNREQLLQYKPGYLPVGDPKTWDTKNNILLHDDVFLVRSGKEFGIAYMGMNEGEQKRTVVVAKNGRGIQRLEWGVTGETAFWEFSGFTSQPILGRLPRTFALAVNGIERVRSTVVSARPTKRDALATARLAAKQPSAQQPPSSQLEEAVRLIVRYR